MREISAKLLLGQPAPKWAIEHMRAQAEELIELREEIKRLNALIHDMNHTQKD